MIGEKKVLFLEMEYFHFIEWKADLNSNIGKKICAGLLTNLLRKELDPKIALTRCPGVVG